MAIPSPTIHHLRHPYLLSVEQPHRRSRMRRRESRQGTERCQRVHRTFLRPRRRCLIPCAFLHGRTTRLCERMGRPGRFPRVRTAAGRTWGRRARSRRVQGYPRSRGEEEGEETGQVGSQGGCAASCGYGGVLFESDGCELGRRDL